jgi:DNA-3-methyladenine glycosylase II
MIRFTISDIKPPFDFDLSAKIFSEGDEQIAKYTGGKYWQVLRVNEKLMLVVIRSIGTTDKPELKIELKSDKRILEKDKKVAKDLICSLFNLKFDLNLFYRTVKNDKVITKLIERLNGLKCGTTPTVFEALVCSIIEQQISLSVALNMEKRLVKKFGDILRFDNEIYYAFPSPEKLAFGTIEQLRACGLSSKKAEYIRDISRSIADGKLELEKFKSYKKDKDIIKELCKIRGIGIWTTELMMVRGMSKWDAIPADDLGLRRCISYYYCQDRRISGEEARKIAEKWREWRGLAGFYLVMAARSGLE